MNATPVVPETEDHRYRRIGITVLAVFIGVFGIWGAIAPLSSAIPASGKISVASNNRVIQHLEGGIVKSILVKDGDSVHSGSTLIELDQTKSKSDLQIVMAKYMESIAQEARLKAERDGQSTIHFPEELTQECLDRNCELLRQGQINEFNARTRFLSGEQTILKQKIDQLKEQTIGLKGSIEANERLSSSYAQEIDELQVLFKQQLTDKVHLREVERQKIKTDNDIANARSDISRINAQIAELHAQIVSQKQTVDKEVAEQLNKVQTDLSDLRSRITALKDTLSRTWIVSPVDGTVTNLQIHTIGGVIPAGKPIMEIVPNGERLIIEGKVAATDIGYVHPGMHAEIRFPGFAHIKTLKIVEGEVIHIAADAISDETSHTLFYPVKIAVTQSGQAELSRNHLRLLPGIPADAMIITGSRTFLDYLVHPFKIMLSKSFNEQ